ncbi:class II fumarate hydratase [Niveibacterium sp. SC-1]|uniref:class II fumarate hydratase n=1 Tax=Niveibacterium sp. SC-1 TaxID=3135646 RepID=UPI00311F766E
MSTSSTAATRMERDSMGELAVPADALWGAQTQRAVENFPISGQPMPRAFIKALIQIKLAAARANGRLGLIAAEEASAVGAACEELLAGDFMPHFPIDVFQTGSGTSSNMNANEVIATLASRRLGRAVSANDVVNFGQSSNDTIPSAIHVAAACAIKNELLLAIAHFIGVTEAKAAEVHPVVKTGRTHLMDAMPVRLSQVLKGWNVQIATCDQNLRFALGMLEILAQGGTAVGTGINTDARFAPAVCEELTHITGITFRSGANRFALMGAQDTAVATSGQLRTLAVALTKIANDLRWMNSGPLAGLGEIELPALQPGSSIMPGKVNPVIPEAVAMVAAQVVGNDACIAMAGASGNFELNVMLPVIARNLLESIALLTPALRLLADKAIAGFTVNTARIEEALSRNPILVTALNPVIGYAKAAEIAKRAYKEKRPIIDVAEEMSGLPRAELERLLDPAALTEGGIVAGGGGGG